MPSIVLADDHLIVREGLRALLEAEPDFTIVGEASDGPEALETVERLKPNVLIINLVMPGLGGLEVTRLISRRKLKTRVVILSMYGNEAYLLQALRNGAAGYVLQECRADELVHAIREVGAGRRYLCSKFSKFDLNTYLEKAQAGKLDPYETLTAREREVLQLTADGNTSAGIAARLEISERTVESHRANLMRKLDLHSQTDLIRYALKRGIILLEET